MLKNTSDNFWKNDDGNFAILFSLAAFVLVTCVGVAIDISRLESAKSYSQDAVDIAVLAAAKVLQESGDKQAAKAAGESVFLSNLGEQDTLQAKGLKLIFRENGTTVEGSTDTTMSTTFMAMAGKKDLEIQSHAVADIGINSLSNIELSLVMDMSTSMCGSGTSGCTSSPKLDAAKQAAVDLIEAVVKDDQSEYSTRVAVIPFGMNLRISPDTAPDSFVETLTGLPPYWSGWRNRCTEWVPADPSSESTYVSCANWEVIYVENEVRTNCISDRYFLNGDYVYTDEEPPGPGFHFHAVLGDRFPLSRDSANTPLTFGTGLTQDDPASTRTYEPNVGPCWNASANYLLPLTDDKDAIQSHINNLQAWGETAGPIGVAFGWYTLSGEWRDIWEKKSRPVKYSELSNVGPTGEPTHKKIMVLLSDGAFNTYLGRLKDKTKTAEVAVELCTNMKAKGIEVFTVGYDLDAIPEDDRALATDSLQQCASSPDHYKYAEDAESLKKEFAEITGTVSGPRLVK